MSQVILELQTALIAAANLTAVKLAEYTAAKESQNAKLDELIAALNAAYRQ